MQAKALLPCTGSLLIALVLPLTLSLAQGQNGASFSTEFHPAPGAKTVSIVTQGTNGTDFLTQLAQQKSLRAEHRRIITEIVGFLPKGCESTLQNFTVRYDHPEHRGLAGKNTVIISGNLPLNEFRGVLVHELLGHMVELGCLEGHQESGQSVFRDGDEVFYNDDPSVAFYRLSWATETQRRTDAKAEDFVTGYAFRGDAFEDLAETVAFYFFQNDAFVIRARKNPVLAQKYAWVKTHVFPQKTIPAKGTFAWNGKTIPWDATKLPYLWSGVLAAAR